MKIINYFYIIIWYLINFKYLPNLFFLVINKIKQVFLNEQSKFTNSKKLEFLSHNLFFKKESIKSLNFKKKKIYLNSLKRSKKIIKNFGGEADLNLLYSICNKFISKKIFILETGVALGWSSLVFLFFFKQTQWFFIFHRHALCKKIRF